MKEDCLMPRPTTQASHRATNITLPIDLLTEARSLGLNISQACKSSPKAEIGRVRTEQWVKDNHSALASSNDYVERNGLPLSGFRQF